VVVPPVTSSSVTRTRSLSSTRGSSLTIRGSSFGASGVVKFGTVTRDRVVLDQYLDRCSGAAAVQHLARVGDCHPHGRHGIQRREVLFGFAPRLTD
jgi:hypothetical protein